MKLYGSCQVIGSVQNKTLLTVSCIQYCCGWSSEGFCST